MCNFDALADYAMVQDDFRIFVLSLPDNNHYTPFNVKKSEENGILMELQPPLYRNPATEEWLRVMTQFTCMT